MKIYNQAAYPLYAQIADDMRLHIQTEKWPEGERIPTEMELCDIYHVSRITIRKAIDELMKENLLVRIRSKGTFVKDTFQEEDHFTIVKGFTQELQERGKLAKTVDVEVKIEHANKRLAKFLNSEVGSEVLVLKRVRGDEDSIFAFFVTYIAYDRDYSLDAKDYYSSFYAYLRTKNISVNQEREYVEAVSPNREVQRKLKIKESEPVLKRVRFTSQADENFYEYTECFYIGKRYRYYLDFRE
ncbi:GntR family transcriptional regulator [Lederbergia galactosidilytica]|uniref:GntR family transcriptional regulator n=1 Tax=Lederbergia galactosidilytica TaxID=217031 RepID=A0A177ZI36_9BACI|nr:GntR family transcriptional regulator [Lederbergia galactosidilytica]KRG15802.1 GntR family transcriptional regulator [Virgibacillus soli]MBP1915488.1 DNA-binding GntR family transcriptional regulator [Lederbergia galactosidilytica]OAK67592.1 GntR family transcriptional regulator [Lederbergia galactosidilytica]